jgi:2-dehydro-3-deoxygluconokinase
VVTSLRESVSATHNNWGGMLYEAKTRKAWFAPTREGRYLPYEVRDIVDRVGAGDAFAAGLIYALNDPELAEPARAVAFAAAAGCLAHSIPGDFNFCSRQEVLALAGGEVSGRVKR